MSSPPAHDWGSAPDFYGPRHAYREALMLRRLLPTLPGPKVVNVGCGAGSLTLALVARGLEVTSVDGSSAFVESLRHAVADRHPGVSAPVLCADVHALPFPDAAFDGAVCGEVLEHLDDDRRAAAEITRVLRPGGVLVATVPAGPQRFDWVDSWAGHRRRYTPGGLVALLEGAGLTGVEVRPWGFPVTALYERAVYKPLLRRRLARAAGDGAGLEAPNGLAEIVAGVIRAALELDSLFGARGAGHPGLLAWGQATAR